MARGPFPGNKTGGPAQWSRPFKTMGQSWVQFPGEGVFGFSPKSRKKPEKTPQTPPERPRRAPALSFRHPPFIAHPGRERDSGEILALSRTRTRSSASRMSTLDRLDCRHPSLSPYVYCSTVRAKSRTESDTTKMLLTVRIVVSHLHTTKSSPRKSGIRFLPDRPRAGCAARHPLLYYPGSEHSGAKSPASGAAVWEIRPRFE